MLDVNKRLFKIDHCPSNIIYHIKQRKKCFLYKVVSNTVVNVGPVDVKRCVVSKSPEITKVDLRKGMKQIPKNSLKITS